MYTIERERFSRVFLCGNTLETVGFMLILGPFLCKDGVRLVSCTREVFRKGVKILIAVVIGALLLAGLYKLFDKTIMPTVTKKVTELFNFKG